MDNLEIRTPVQPNVNDAQAQYDELRHLIVSVLILVIVISGTFNIYLLRQWRSTRRVSLRDPTASRTNDRRVSEGERPIDERFH